MIPIGLRHRNTLSHLLTTMRTYTMYYLPPLKNNHRKCCLLFLPKKTRHRLRKTMGLITQVFSSQLQKLKITVGLTRMPRTLPRRPALYCQLWKGLETRAVLLHLIFTLHTLLVILVVGLAYLSGRTRTGYLFIIQQTHLIVQ